MTLLQLTTKSLITAEPHHCCMHTVNREIFNATSSCKVVGPEAEREGLTNTTTS